MIRELKEVEQSSEGGRMAFYLRFSNLPIARTEAFAGGLVNVDIDHYNEVVGIEVLDTGGEAIGALGTIVREHGLAMGGLFEYAARGSVRTGGTRAAR